MPRYIWGSQGQLCVCSFQPGAWWAWWAEGLKQAADLGAGVLSEPSFWP